MMLALRLGKTCVKALGEKQVWKRMVARSMATLPPHTLLNLPALSPTMEEGKIASWLKKEGESVSAGQSVCEIETDKSTMDFEMQDDGILAKILVQAGSDPLPVGSVIGVLVEDQDDVAAFKSVTVDDLIGGSAEPPKENTKSEPPTESTSTKPPAEKEAPIAASPSKNNVPQSSDILDIPEGSRAPAAPRKSDGTRVIASPLARLIANQHGLDLTKVSGSGPKGRIIRADVEDALSRSDVVTSQEDSTGERAVKAGGAESYFDLPVSSSSQEIAQQLSKSKKEVPHYYLSSEINVTSLLNLRAELNSNLKEDEKISVNDFIVRAAALCMSRVPQVNSSWGDSFIRQYNNADINVSIISEDENAMLMPVIRAANHKGLSAISRESREFMVNADGESEVDFGIGTFTVTNMGAFGLKSFTPIVREPQACSLGVGAITQKAIPGPVGEDGKATVAIVDSMTVTMSCDHRVVDGAVGAEWLEEFKQLLEKPVQMLL